MQIKLLCFTVKVCVCMQAHHTRSFQKNVFRLFLLFYCVILLLLLLLVRCIKIPVYQNASNQVLCQFLKYSLCSG